jgi:hypothetical protein
MKERNLTPVVSKAINWIYAAVVIIFLIVVLV